MAIDFTTLPDLCDERLGSAVVGRNDEYFALADNLLRPEPPVFVADRFTKRGKWMDGWETRRRRTPGVDWCIVRLGAPGVVRGIVVDTAHFTGNFPQACWLEGCSTDGYPSAEELADAEWLPLGPRTQLTGDSKHLINVTNPARITHVRLTISPDGGVARLHVHGEPLPDPRDIWGMPLDLGALEHGGVVV
ncbi:MAG: allantoicase, partial [Actinomycetes bacterium]